MNTKMLLALFGVMLFGAGLVMAISGAVPTLVADQARWAGNTSGSDVTEGGNISAVNVAGSTLTDRWAAYFGNVSGTILLADSTNASVYTWAWTSSNGGEVCLSTGPAYVFTSAVAAVPSEIDTAFSLGAASDNATKTFTTTGCTLNFNSIASIINIPDVSTTGGFVTCAIKAGGTAKANHAFCTKINDSGTAYNSASANYQVMVPTEPVVATTETYYFYMELN